MLFFFADCNPIILNKTSLKNLVDERRDLLLLGAISPIEILFMSASGFKAAYISGAALSTSLGLLDDGKITLNKMGCLVREIRKVSDIPVLADCDTGFRNISKTVSALEAAGADAIQIEDQVPTKKRCGHLDGKKVVPLDDMTEKISHAVLARKNKDFLIAARTDARATDGLQAAIWRACCYREAGADLIFPEALMSVEEFRIFRRDVRDIPLIANLAEGGKTPNMRADVLFKMGYSIVLIPATPIRLMLRYYEFITKQAINSGSLEYMITNKGILSRQTIIDFIKNNSKVYKR